MATLFFPGKLSFSYCEEIINERATNEEVVALVPEKILKKWNSQNKDRSFSSILSISKMSDVIEELEDINIDGTGWIYGCVINDARTFYIIERQKSYLNISSSFNDMVEIIALIKNTISLVKKYDINKCIFPTTPHTKVWIIAKVAELLGAKIFYTQVSPIPYKRWIVEGLDENTKSRNIDGEKDPVTLNKWIEKLKGSYELGMPSYERKRKNKFNNKENSFYVQLRNTLSKKDLKRIIRELLSFRYRMNVITGYFELSTTYNDKFPEKYIYFPLHYQPERNTIPEGMGYAHQFRAIVELVSYLPKDFKLLIKEHPSTFRNWLNPRFRDTNFYEKLSEIKQVELVNINEDSFSLIDHAKGVATITGTVSIEAALRNKPILFFGCSRYKSIPNNFFWGNEKERSLYLQRILSEPLKLKESKDMVSEVEEALGNIDSLTFFKDGNQYDSPSFEALKKSFCID